MLDPSSNPLLISAGITTSITCAISGYALYELLSVGPEETQTARAIDSQLRRQPISAEIIPNVSAPQSWNVRPGTRPDFLPIAIASNTPSPEAAVAQTLLVLWKQGKLPQQLAPLLQQVESGIDEVQAKGYLEAARIQATQQDYAKALKYLEQISTDTTVHSQAQIKIAEYSQKQTLQATAWMRKANALAKLKDFSGARIYLKQVPNRTPVYPSAQNKLTEYAQTQNVQANFWFEEASKLATQGKLSDAISYLKRIPLGTSIYTVAQNKIAEYSQKQNLKAATPKPTVTPLAPTKLPKPETGVTTPNPAVVDAKPPKPETGVTTPNPAVVDAKPPKPETGVTTPTPTVAQTPAVAEAKPPKPETGVTMPNPAVVDAKPPKPETGVTIPTPTVAQTPAVAEAKPPKPETGVTMPNPAVVDAKPPKPETGVTTPTPTVTPAPAQPLVVDAPNQTTVANPNSTSPVTTPSQPSVAASGVPSGAQAVDSNHPSESATPPAASLANPRAASVTPSNPQSSASRELQTSGTGENSIVQPPLSRYNSSSQTSNSQTLPTPARVPSTTQPRPQIRPETLQTPRFMPKPELQRVPKIEQPETAAPATSLRKNPVKREDPTELTPVNPQAMPKVQLKKAPSDTDTIWNSESFTRDSFTKSDR